MSVERVPFLDLQAAHRELEVELDSAYQRVLKSGRYLLGRETDAFEREFATFCGARFCVAVGSGLDALHFSLRAMDIGEGDEVVVPGYTFIATWLAVSWAGAKPVPVDVTWPDGNIDPTLIEQAITPRTRAIVPVHLYGKPAAMRMIQQIAQRHGLALLEDAAQAHGAKIGSHRVGTFGQAAAFSFYPGKNLGALADGGAVVTDDEHLDSRLRALRNYGMRERYHHDTRGFNSRIDEFQAAFLRAKLVKLDAWNARRCEVANRYMEHLEPIDAIECQQPENDFQHVWHLFVVCVKDRDSFERYLGECGIDVLIHYPIPPHRSGAYADAFGAWNTRLPVSERMAAAALSLPMGPHVTDAHIDRVLIAIHNFLEGTATVLNRGSST